MTVAMMPIGLLMRMTLLMRVDMPMIICTARVTVPMVTVNGCMAMSMMVISVARMTMSVITAAARRARFSFAVRRVPVVRAENVESNEIEQQPDGGNHHHLPAAGGEALLGLVRVAAAMEWCKRVSKSDIYKRQSAESRSNEPVKIVTHR